MTKLTGYQKWVIGLTIFTALGHLIYSYGWENSILGINLGVWFIINGTVYLLILYILYFSSRFEDNRNMIRYTLAGWTLGSIIAWILFHTSSVRYTTLLDASLINKTVEVLILVFLYLDMKSSSVNNKSQIDTQKTNQSPTIT